MVLLIGTSSTFRGWVRVRVLGYGSGVRGRKVKSRDYGGPNGSFYFKIFRKFF